jgi:hypothetical protein
MHHVREEILSLMYAPIRYPMPSAVFPVTVNLVLERQQVETLAAPDRPARSLRTERRTPSPAHPIQHQHNALLE